jgi:diketogulonate reductase-like aldo/keto reductase
MSWLTVIVYHNEEEVGQAIKASGLSRKELWITTKWSGVDGKDPRQSCDESLEMLGIKYIDLYLIHSPKLCGDDIKGKWKEMEKLHKEGKVKSIGVSKYVISLPDMVTWDTHRPSFGVDQLKELLRHAEIKPVVNQILLHPYVIKSTEPLLHFMLQHHIVPEGYSTLIPLTSRPGGPVDKPVNKIAERLGKKPEQVLLAWSKAKK